MELYSCMQLSPPCEMLMNARISNLDPKYMYSGLYGVIHFDLVFIYTEFDIDRICYSQLNKCKINVHNRMYELSLTGVWEELGRISLTSSYFFINVISISFCKEYIQCTTKINIKRTLFVIVVCLACNTAKATRSGVHHW